MPVVLLYIFTIAFIATLVRSTFGFGESLVAVPLFSLFIPIAEAVPLSVMLSVVVALVVVVQDHRQIQFNSAKWLILFSTLGIPIGLLVLVYGNETWVKTGLGIVISLYALYSLLGKNRLHLQQDHKAWLFGCGLAAGILGGAYGLNGPPLVIYGNLRKWNAQHFRATLQGYFLPASIVGIAGYWMAGLWTPAVTRDFLICLPVLWPAIWLGRVLNHRMHGDGFLRYVYLGLMGIAALLLVQSMRP